MLGLEMTSIERTGFSTRELHTYMLQFSHRKWCITEMFQPKPVSSIDSKIRIGMQLLSGYYVIESFIIVAYFDLKYKLQFSNIDMELEHVYIYIYIYIFLKIHKFI
jgi:hypothetical protein